jgi:unsaturated rhamnogalacturonyl hydrolase
MLHTYKSLRIAAATLTLAALSTFTRAAAPQAPDPSLGQGKIVALDQFFNHQEKNGKQFHYVWSDTANTGFSKFGDVWKQNGAQITSFDHAPTADDLKKTSVYIICCPSTEEIAVDHKPNYIEEPAISAFEQWVKDGGVLLLLANDPSRCVFKHFNDLATRFGFTYDGNDRNTAPTTADRPPAIFPRDRDHFPDHPVFAGLDKIYLKEISTITVKDPATALLIVDKDPKESIPGDDGVGPGKDVIMFTAKIGKGTVFAIGDPWIYNEYIDLNKPPVDNRKGAVNLVQWLLTQASPPQTN